MKHLKKLMLIVALFITATVVHAETTNNSQEDVGLYLNTTENVVPEEKTNASEDTKRVWNVVFSTSDLVWNVNQNINGETYHYVWNAETGKYSRITDQIGGTITTTISNNETTKIIDITNKSNFDITPSITISNQNIPNLFNATYNAGLIAWNTTKSAIVTIDSSILEEINELIPGKLIVTNINNEEAYIAGNVVITLNSGSIYASDYNKA